MAGRRERAFMRNGGRQRIARQKEIDASIAARPSSNFSTTSPMRTIAHPRRRTVHRREPVAAPRRSRSTERRTDRLLEAAEGKRAERSARRGDRPTSPR